MIILHTIEGVLLAGAYLTLAGIALQLAGALDVWRARRKRRSVNNPRS